MNTQLFFGASTGRTATMHLANCLNAEPGCTCVHEGKFRHRETSGEQILPFLTLENRIAYETPDKAAGIIDEKRAVIDTLDLEGLSHFGDIAYNNSPFLVPLSARFPTARFVLIVRDGRTFPAVMDALSATVRFPGYLAMAALITLVFAVLAPLFLLSIVL